MNAERLRQLFEYYRTANRRIWESHIMGLSQEQFLADTDYSVGSVRNQIVHMINVDDRWFSGLLEREVPAFIDPNDYSDRTAIREMWDRVEANMDSYLSTLNDDMLANQPFPPIQGTNLELWQILFHILNHGTDHRAQLLRLLHDHGCDTKPQDYLYFCIGHL